MLSYRLRHRVAIQEKTNARDTESGELEPTWSNVFLDSDTELDEVPAEVLLGPGREARAAGTDQASIDARINLRWFEGLHQHMRILWDGRIFNIHSMETDLTGRQEWRLRCTSGLNQGD